MSPSPRPPFDNPRLPAVRRSGLLLACLVGLGLAAGGAACTKDAASGSASGGAKGSASGGVMGTSSGGTNGGSGGATGSGGTNGGSGTGGASSGSGSGGTSAGSGSGGAVETSSGGTTGGSTSGGASGAAGGSATGGTTVVRDGGETDAACQMATVKFAPKTPNVLVLVDGSGSMFNSFKDSTGANTTRWDALKKAVLPIIASLETQVNFGLGVFSGINNMCPIFKTVPIAPNNSAAIMSAYPTRMSLGPDGDLQTPLPQVFDMQLIPPLFKAAKGNGGSYILLATDGEPDFCDNGTSVCPIDAVLAGIKALATQSIQTFVIGLASDINMGSCPNVLTAYANAGQNMPITPPCKDTKTGTDVANQCANYNPWKALATKAGRTAGQALVDYVDPDGGVPGTAKAFMPNVADQASLTNTLAALFNGVKSCSFDLGDLDGQTIKVDMTQLSSAHVCLGTKCPDTTEIPQDPTNGWSMTSSTQLTLNGTACEKWRMPNNNDISFDFPCKSIIFESTTPPKPSAPQGRK